MVTCQDLVVRAENPHKVPIMETKKDLDGANGKNAPSKMTAAR